MGKELLDGSQKQICGKEKSGEFTIEQFATKHSCSQDDASKLRDKYLKLVPKKGCSYPYAILDAILGLDSNDIPALSMRLDGIIQTRQHSPKSTS